MASERDLTEGPVLGHVFALAVPTGITLVFLTLYNVTDVFFAGQVSTAAQAGLGVGSQVFFMVIAMGIGLRVAMSAVVGQTIGRKTDPALPVVAHGFGISLVLTVVAAGIGYFALPAVIHLIAEGEYAGLASDFARWMLLSTPGFILAQSLGGALAGQGDTVTFAIAQAGAALLNVALDPLFVFGVPGWWDGFGLDGIAFATIGCQTAVLVWVAVRSAGSSAWRDGAWSELVLDLPLVRRIVFQALPVSGSLLVTVLGGVVTQWLLQPYGEAAVAGYGVSYRLEQVLLLPILGVCSALLPITSQNVGARRIERAREAFWQVFGLGAGLSVLAIVLVWTVGRLGVSLFSDDPEVIRHGLAYLRVESFVLIGFVVMSTVQNLLQGIERPWWPALVGVWRQGIGIALFGLLFTEVLGLDTFGIWLGTAVSIATGALLAAFFGLVIPPRAGLSLLPGAMPSDRGEDPAA